MHFKILQFSFNGFILIVSLIGQSIVDSHDHIPFFFSDYFNPDAFDGHLSTSSCISVQEYGFLTYVWEYSTLLSVVFEPLKSVSCCIPIILPSFSYFYQVIFTNLVKFLDNSLRYYAKQIFTIHLPLTLFKMGCQKTKPSRIAHPSHLK